MGEWINEHIDPGSGVLHSNEKGRAIAMCHHVDKSPRCAEREKPEAESMVLFVCKANTGKTSLS